MVTGTICSPTSDLFIVPTRPDLNCSLYVMLIAHSKCSTGDLYQCMNMKLMNITLRPKTEYNLMGRDV